MRTLRLVVLLIGVANLACIDGTGPPGLVHDLDIVVPAVGREGQEAWVKTIVRERERPLGISPILVPEEEPSGGGGSGLPPEWQAWPTIQTYWSDAGVQPTFAYGQGHMEYFASHARQEVRLEVRFNGSYLTAITGKSEESAILPWFRDLTTSTRYSIDRACGHRADATTDHSAWHQPPLPIPGVPSSWGKELRSSRHSGEQSPCPPEVARDTVESTGFGSGNVGGGGDTGWYTCYYYIEYDLATGEITYSAFLGCVGLGG